ncbi:MAG: NADH-quinone oxidoreductase subunit J [Edaphobacter sp.]
MPKDLSERIILLFTIFAILTVTGAVAAMSLRNLVHSVLALTVAFSGLAAVYLLLGAQFVGLAQILVYVGAVAILVVFAILLTRDSGTVPLISGGSWRLLRGSGIVVFAVFGVLAWAICHSSVGRHTVHLSHDTSIYEIGNVMMQRFALPLEIVGALLTVALIGAVTIAMQEKEGRR